MASSAALRTPAERLIEIQQELARAEFSASEAEVKIKSLERELSRFRSFSNASFGGIPMAQYWCDLVLWESVLNSNPDMYGVIEIGTWQGGFSSWLYAQAETRKMDFVSFDAVDPPTVLPDWFVRCDVFAKPDQVRMWIDAFENHDRPIILFCDGGNKPRELETFAPMLKHPESLVAVHDWGTETLSLDVPKGLTEVYGKYCDELGSITRWFKWSDASS